NLSKDDVVIFISQSGETTETTEAAMITKKLGIKTICITTATKNRLSSLCDVTIKTTGMNDNIEISPTTLKVSQMFAIDTLFLNLIKEDKGKYNDLLVKNGYIKNR
ncbi:MAG: SIS domain-containing protein, partial [Oscillospiraceae bacterium]